MKTVAIPMMVMVTMVLRFVSSFPHGAPNSVCDSLLVIHHKGTILKQEGPPPYEVTIARNNEDVIVTIASPTAIPFEGFMMQARSTDGKIVGVFESGSTEFKTIDCQKPGDTTTHSGPEAKPKLDIRWKPSGHMGEVTFNSTIAKDFSTFWVGVQSPAIVVDWASQVAPPAAEESSPDIFYDSCGVDKLCFGFPDGCVLKQGCRMILAVKANRANEKYEFEMKGRGSPAWVAVGLSDDTVMGDDSVLECAKEGDQVKPYVSWNTPRPNLNAIRSESPLDVQLMNSSVVDGVLYCRVSRYSKSTMNNITFDFDNTKYNVLIASGSYNKNSSVGYHDIGQLSSSGKILLSDVVNLGGASDILMRLHGACMLAAWIGTASIGTFVARYYKKTWTNQKVQGKDVWFATHYLLMVVTWGLTTLGFILIFAELQGWSTANNPHAIMGCVVTILCFLQPIGAFFRPPPTSDKRPLFNWLHWLGGTLAYCLAIASIFMAAKLPKTNLPESYVHLLIAFLISYTIMHLVLSILQQIADNSSIKQVSSMRSSQSGNLFARKDDTDARFSSVRKYLLGLYAAAICILTIYLIIVVVTVN